MSTYTMTAQQLADRVRDRLLSEGIPWQHSYSDGFTMGDPDIPVRGIAVTFKPTTDVLARAAERGLNLVISHEAAFWEGFDTSQIMPSDPVRRGKQAFVDEREMAVWRLHDHMHRMHPEPIFRALFDKLDWSEHLGTGNLQRIEIPPRRLADLAEYLQLKLETDNVTVVGDPELSVNSVGFGIHVLSTILPALRRSDVAIVGETAEYDSFEYMRDAVALGEQKGLIRIGHERLEAWGVSWFADWLRPLVPDIPVEWVSTGEPFTLPRRP